MSVVTVTISSNGKPVPPEFPLLYLDITNECNRIPYAEFAYNDGDPASQTYPVTDSDFFEPGKEIEIKLRYEGDAKSETKVFSGVVVKLELKMGAAGSVVVVEASHTAIKMTGTRKSARFEEFSDSEVIRKIINPHGLKVGTIDTTGVTHKQLVQYQSTDWDFVLTRAEANGLLLIAGLDDISAMIPKDDKAPVQTFRFGLDPIFSFDMAADARHQFTAVESQSWDIKKQELIIEKTTKEVKLSPGNLSPATATDAASGKTETLVSAVTLNDKEAKAWREGRMMRNRLAFVKGRLSVQGTALSTTGSVVKLEGMSERFSGPVFVTGVRHRVDGNGWITDLQFGLSPEPLSATANITDARAAGLLPGVNGLQIGKVTKITEDPDGEARIKVTVPALNESGNGYLWSRMATQDAGKERGMCFWPEVDDEVILGFLNDDPRQAVVLGSLYGSANLPPLPADEQNFVKGFVTKEGLKLIFNDEKKLVTILTSEKNCITVNETDKLIEIKDVNNNVITLDSNGVTIESAKDVMIKSKGDMTFQATGSVNIKGQKIDVT